MEKRTIYLKVPIVLNNPNKVKLSRLTQPSILNKKRRASAFKVVAFLKMKMTIILGLQAPIQYKAVATMVFRTESQHCRICQVKIKLLMKRGKMLPNIKHIKAKLVSAGK